MLKHVIMMNLKISGFLIPVQILKYALICNIFMQARMKYRASRNRLARHFENFCLFILKDVQCKCPRLYADNCNFLEFRATGCTF